MADDFTWLRRGLGSATHTEVPVITALFKLIDVVIDLYIWALILAAIVSMLTAAGVLDGRNRLVSSIGDFLYRVTEPLLRPLRNVLPNFGNIDLSPLVVILLLQYIARPLLRAIYSGIVFGVWTPVLF